MTKQMMVVIGLFLFVFIRSVFVEPNSLDVTIYQIENAQLQGITAAFLSDFHLKKSDRKRLDKIVKTVQKQNPNIVFLGGDFAINKNYKSMMNMELVALKLREIKAPIYSVLGSQDWRCDGKKIAQALKDNGITVLENSRRRIILGGRYLDVIGLADLKTRTPDIARAMYRSTNPRIILTHNPDVYYSIADNVTLILAGHTHGGQFNLPFVPPVFVPSKYARDFASGLIKTGNNQMIVTRGLGTSILPVRLNCKPEVVIIRFTRPR